VIVCHSRFLLERCKQRGYELEQVMPCVVAQDGDEWTIDTEHPAYPREKKPWFQRGPGTQLKKLLAKIGISPTPSCSCNKRAMMMDEREHQEPGWCEANLDTIVGWLREEATKRGLPFLDAAGRLLVKRAIRNARRAAS
jgi:hypothetical protein